jgi:hypothetical protein
LAQELWQAKRDSTGEKRESSKSAKNFHNTPHTKGTRINEKHRMRNRGRMDRFSYEGLSVSGIKFNTWMISSNG